MEPQEHQHHQPLQQAASSFLQKLLAELSDLNARLGGKHPEVADMLNIIGLCYHHLSTNQDKALQFHKEALDILKLCMDFSSSQTEKASISKNIAVTLTDIGNVHSKRGDIIEARASYDDALCIFRDLKMSSEGNLMGSMMRGISRISDDWSTK